MSDETKQPDGPISVDHNADVTPITKQPIDKINATNWEDMSFGDLSDQYNMLQKRIDMAKSMGRSDMCKQMNQGLQYLQQLIQEKTPKDDNSKGLFI